MNEWEDEFPWLQPDIDESSMIVGMYCLLCKHHKTKNKFNQSAELPVHPYVEIVFIGSLSDQHKEAVENKMYRERHGGIRQAFQSQIELNKSALKIAKQLPILAC